DLSKYLQEIGVKTKYLHSDIDTLERMHIIKDLRNGNFDVLVGVNLLREGLDIPEVSLVVILDADKEGFLRSETALVQTCGRAARNVHGRVVMYADRMTKAIQNTVDITQKRRKIQMEYNQKHGIVPKSVKREQIENLEETFGMPIEDTTILQEKKKAEKAQAHMEDLDKKIKEYKIEMKNAAKELRFEDAAKYRDLIRYYENLAMLK
ncbi:MAG: helicase-related protein, partial [Chlamydiota bacterium]